MSDETFVDPASVKAASRRGDPHALLKGAEPVPLSGVGTPVAKVGGGYSKIDVVDKEATTRSAV